MTEGPFGLGAGGVPDLGAIAAAKQAEEMGLQPLPVVIAQLMQMNVQTNQQIINELAGIRTFLTPIDARLHVATVMEVVNKDGQPIGWGVYCVQCSDEASEFVNPCRLRKDLSEWPPNLLVASPYAESPVQTASPEMPDTVDELLEEDPEQ